MSKWETKKKRNPWRQKFPESEGIQRIQRAETNKNMKIQDMLSTRSWCAACVEGRGVSGQHRIEPSTKALQDAVIHACVGVELIPQGPPEGDHMANGRVKWLLEKWDDSVELFEFPLNKTPVYHRR